MKHRKAAFVGSIVVLATLGAACATAGPRLRHTAGAYSLEVRSQGRRLTVYPHKGQSYVMGKLGHRYTLRIRNHSARRIEAVVTVDGRDVLDGKRGRWGKRGYLIAAWGHVDIDGWRLSDNSVAAFRFSSVANSYAARTGSARNVGVIGVAVFPERRRRPVYVPRPRPYPDWEYGGREYSKRRAPAGESSASDAAKSTPSAPRSRAGVGKALAQRRKSRRPGLGTGFGEHRYSPVTHVAFKRANPTRPAALLGVRYNDRRGLLAMGVDLSYPYGYNWHRDNYLRNSASAFPAEYKYASPPPGWEYR